MVGFMLGFLLALHRFVSFDAWGLRGSWPWRPPQGEMQSHQPGPGAVPSQRYRARTTASSIREAHS